MRIGLIDVDGHNYPNLPLMKLSAWHKQKGDLVEWYEPFKGLLDEYDIVYMSKIFSFSPDYQQPIYAKKIHKGGSGTLTDQSRLYRISSGKRQPPISSSAVAVSMMPESTWGTRSGAQQVGTTLTWVRTMRWRFLKNTWRLFKRNMFLVH